MVLEEYSVDRDSQTSPIPMLGKSTSLQLHALRLTQLRKRDLEFECRVPFPVLGVVQCVPRRARRYVVVELDKGNVLPPWDRSYLVQVRVTTSGRRYSSVRVVAE
jgi:hypothetical protein